MKTALCINNRKMEIQTSLGPLTLSPPNLIEKKEYHILKESEVCGVGCYEIIDEKDQLGFFYAGRFIKYDTTPGIEEKVKEPEVCFV